MQKIILYIMCILGAFLWLMLCTNRNIPQESVIENVSAVRTYTAQPIQWEEIIIIPSSTPTPKSEVFTITAYDLSVKCCGKTMRHREYGITSRGDSIRGHSRKEAMAVAVDTRLIPLGSVLKIEFIDKEYQKYNGIYTAIDTGSAVKGHIIDLFMGDFESRYPAKETSNFGSAKSNIIILKKGNG